MKTVKLDLDAEHQKYITDDGQQVPGASTISQIGKDTGGMTHKAWQLGKKGINYKDEWRESAIIGTTAHFLIQGYLEEFKPDCSAVKTKLLEKSVEIFYTFKKYWDDVDFKFKAAEVQLVDSKLRYGGTLDILATDKWGRLVLIDIKSSKDIFDSYRCQLAAYEHLWRINHPADPILRRGIWRFGKAGPKDVNIETWEDIEIQLFWKAYVKQLELFYALRDLPTRR